MGDAAKTLPKHKKRATEAQRIRGSEVLARRSSTLHEDADLLPYILPSHSKTLFTHLHSLKEEELLLDCTFLVQGKAFHAHKLVLAAASQDPNLFLGPKQNHTLTVEEVSHCVTSLGFRAVVEFAYCGDVALDLSKGGEIEEVLTACQCLRMERLRERCMSKVTTSAATETEKSLASIKDMWEEGMGCDVTIRAETGETYAGKMHLREETNSCLCG